MSVGEAQYMKKLFVMIAVLLTSCLFMASANANAASDNAAAGQQNDTRPAEKKTGLSKRNKAKIQQSEQARMRREAIQSGASNTAPKRKLSKHNRAKIEQTEQAKIRKQQLKKGAP
jgi:hypothetical protein